MTNYRIKRHYMVVPHTPNVVELRSGAWNPISFTLTDDSGSGALHRVIQRFDGSATAAAIARAEGVPKADVEALLDHLIELGVVEDRASSAFDLYADTCLPSTFAPAGTAARYGALLVGDSDLSERLGRNLRSSGLDGVDALDAGSDAARLVSVADTSRLLNGLTLHEDLQAFASWKGCFVAVIESALNPVRMLYLNRVMLERAKPDCCRKRVRSLSSGFPSVPDLVLAS